MNQIEIVNTECKELVSGTELSVDISCDVGNILLATITSRSEILLTDDWELIWTSNYVTNGSTKQWLHFAKKKANAISDTITVRQTNQGRIYINLIAIRGIVDIIHYPLLTTYVNSEIQTVGYQIKVPNKQKNESIIWGGTSILWALNSSYGDWKTIPDDLQLISLNQSITQPRLANFIDLGAGKEIDRYFIASPNSSGGYVIISAVKLIVDPIKYLIRDYNGLYKVSEDNTTLIQLEETELSSSLFINHGTDQIPNGDLMKELINPKLLQWCAETSVNIKLKASVKALPNAQTIIQDYFSFYNDESIKGLSHFKVYGEINEQAIVRFAVSFDGVIYYTFNNAWEPLDITSDVLFLESGMSKEALEGLTQTQLEELFYAQEIYKFKVAIIIDYSNINAIANIEQVRLNFIN